jgi:hypothetical protein
MDVHVRQLRERLQADILANHNAKGDDATLRNGDVRLDDDVAGYDRVGDCHIVA